MEKTNIKLFIQYGVEFKDIILRFGNNYLFIVPPLKISIVNLKHCVSIPIETKTKTEIEDKRHKIKFKLNFKPGPIRVIKGHEVRVGRADFKAHSPRGIPETEIHLVSWSTY